jgi:hypothetical protein
MSQRALWADDAGLNERSQIVSHRPVLNDPVVLKAEAVGVTEVDTPARRWSGPLLDGSGALYAYPCDDLVSLGDQCLHLDPEVGHRSTEPFEGAFTSAGPKGTPSSGQGDRSNGDWAWLRPVSA